MSWWPDQLLYTASLCLTWGVLLIYFQLDIQFSSIMLTFYCINVVVFFTLLRKKKFFKLLSYFSVFPQNQNLSIQASDLEEEQLFAARHLIGASRVSGSVRPHCSDFIHHLLMLGRKPTHWFFLLFFFSLPPKQFEFECSALTNDFISRLMDIFLAPDWPWLCTELHQSEGMAAERAAPSQNVALNLWVYSGAVVLPTQSLIQQVN